MELEDDSVELKDDSSFEILPSSEEEEYSANSSMWSSTLNGSLYESMGCSFSTLRMMEESDANSGIVSRNSNASASRSHSQTEFVRNPELNFPQNQYQVQKAAKDSTGDAVSIDARCENHSGITEQNAVAEIRETDSPTFEIIECQQPASERVENFKSMNFEEAQLFSGDSLLVANVNEDAESLATDRVVSTPLFQLQTEFVGNSEFESRRNQKHIKDSFFESAGDAGTIDTDWETHSYQGARQCTCPVKHIIYQNAFAEITERDSPSFGTEYHYQAYENGENYFSSPEDAQWSSDDALLITNMEENSESQSSFNLYQSESNLTGQPLIRKPENTVIQMPYDRTNSSKKICPIMKHSLKLCSWLRNNRCLQNFVDGAKSTFNIFLNKFELEMNYMFGIEDPLSILIIADTADSSIIEESFYQSFSGQVVISKCQIEADPTTIPVLPIGYNCALQVVQSKMGNARQLIRNSEKMIVVSVANFIAEIIPQRWQASTVLCLEDPNLQLNLHNFTSTIPVPNEYIDQAQSLTSKQYPFKEQGLAVTLEDVIRISFKTDSRDAQEFLTGVHRFSNLKSGADILSGMYKKYTRR